MVKNNKTVDLPGQQKEDKEKKQPIRNRINSFISGLGIAGAGASAYGYRKNIQDAYHDYVYPRYKGPGREANALTSDPQIKNIGNARVLTIRGEPHMAQQIIGSPVARQLVAADTLYPGALNPGKTWVLSVPTVEASAVSADPKTKATTVMLSEHSSPFTLAHELGHAVSRNETTPSFAQNLHTVKSKIQKNTELRKTLKETGLLGAGVVGATSKTLAGAATKGALVGALSNAHMILPEIAATHRGLKIMKEAGLKPTYGTGVAQVGGYLAGSIIAPTALSVGVYGLTKAKEALMNKANKKKQEQQP